MLGHSTLGDDARGLSTIQRTFHTYSWGDKTYTCLVIDGGIVPLCTPPVGGPKVEAGDGVTITWPKDGTVATIRTASREEAALADMMGQPDAAEAWKKAIVSTLHDSGFTYKVNEFQPDFMDVNHWRIGAITMDFSIGGRQSASLLMIWRCKDGSTLTVTMQADPEPFKAHSKELFSMIGASMLLNK
jgi:hypothetical protein